MLQIVYLQLYQHYAATQYTQLFCSTSLFFLDTWGKEPLGITGVGFLQAIRPSSFSMLSKY